MFWEIQGWSARLRKEPGVVEQVGPSRPVKPPDPRHPLAQGLTSYNIVSCTSSLSFFKGPWRVSQG